MELHRALAQVAKYAATGKMAPELYHSVQLLPADGGLLARVFATDGLAGSLIEVDVDLPMGLLPLEAVKAVAKQKILSVTRDGDEITFRLAPGGIYRLTVKESLGYPSAPVIPKMLAPITHWHWIRKAVHAAADKKAEKPLLAYMRFRPTCVEATDAYRVAVVNASGWPFDRLVLARLLKGWAEYPTPLAEFTDTQVWLQRGTEYRYAPLKADGAYPDCKALTSDDHDGPYLTVDVSRLRGAVVRATAVSPLKTVALGFDGEELVIKSWAVDAGGKVFRAVLSGKTRGPVGSALKIVSGKFLSEALKMVDTPNVRLGYRDLPNDPLRVESGAWVECLWPWKVGDT